MPVYINCTQNSGHLCLHPEAPKSWFSKPECILINPGRDKRVDLSRCMLQIKYQKPAAPQKTNVNN